MELQRFGSFSSCPNLVSILHLLNQCQILSHGTFFFRFQHKVYDFHIPFCSVYNTPFKLMVSYLNLKIQIKNLISSWSDEKLIMQFPSVGIFLPAIKSRPYSLAHLMASVARQGDLKQSL